MHLHMKRFITLSTILVAAVTAMSCSKDTISPEELFRDETKVAKTTIHTKVEGYEDIVATFSDKTVFRYDL